MDNFIVSARKYRPDSFKTVVGQQSITQTLKNSIKNEHLGHAYLFCGPRGVGKTTCARIFAKTINCEHPTEDYEACNECESCKAFNENRSYNIHELDAASNNSVEDIRNLIEQVRIPPQIGTYSVYIIDEVHMLSSQAFNAFLKTLEEPPGHAIFVLATTEKHKILPTILSRCQIFDFNRIKVEDAVNHLEYVAKSEGINADRDALNIIAQKADGAMRDALSFFDQIVSFAGNTIKYQDAIDNLNVLDYQYYFKLTDCFMQNDIAGALLILDEILDKGFDGHHFISGLSTHFRDLLVCQNPKTVELMEVGDNIKKRYLEQAQQADISFLFKVLDISNKTDLVYRDSKNKRLQIELALIKACNVTNVILEQPTNVNQSQRAVAQTTNEVQAEYKKTETKQPDVKTETSENKNEAQKTEFKNTAKVSPLKKKIKTSGISLNRRPKTVEDKPEEKEELLKGTSSFTQEQVEAAWAAFTAQIKNKPRLYHNLQNRIPTITADNNLNLNVPTEQFQQYIENIKTGILSILRKELNNGSVDLIISVVEDTAPKDETRLYTDKDRYEYLSKKNSNVDKLKQSFNLDF